VRGSILRKEFVAPYAYIVNGSNTEDFDTRLSIYPPVHHVHQETEWKPRMDRGNCTLARNEQTQGESRFQSL